VTSREASAVVLGLVITALFWIDPVFIPLALLGPLVYGVWAGIKRYAWRWPAIVAVVSGLGAVVSDWLVNHEDVVFHLVLTVVMLALASLAWAVAGRAASARRAASR
jgi:hypothetical protein